jgi:hypothetical protein
VKVLEINPGIGADFSIPGDVDLVQFCKKLNDDEYQLLAKELVGRPEVGLRVYHSGRTEFTNLEFLAYFPDVRKLSIELCWLTDISGFEAVRDLEELTFGWTDKKSYSLQLLKRFGSLRKLYIEGHKKDIEAITTLKRIRRLTLRSITLPNIEFLCALPDLQHLEIKLGGTKDLRGLASLEHLKYLELWLIKGLADLSVIAEVVSLESLFLQALKNVTELPSMRALEQLQSIHLETMKGLTDLHPVAEAHNLKTLRLIDMPNIDPKGLTCFIGHPSLREFHGGLGSLKKNAYAEALLGLPPSVWLPPGAREKAALEILKETAKHAVN